MHVRESVISGKCMHVQGNIISGKCAFWEIYIRDNVVSAMCFLGKCNFWKVFFGEVYRIPLRDVALVRNKYLIVTFMHFYFKTMRLSVLYLYDDRYCSCYEERYYGPCVNILSLQNP